MGEAAKPLLFEGVKAGCNVDFAWQSWHFVTCQKSCCDILCDSRNSSFASFSEDELHCSWQAQHIRRVVLHVFMGIAKSGLCQAVTECKFRGRHGML